MERRNRPNGIAMRLLGQRTVRHHEQQGGFGYQALSKQTLPPSNSVVAEGMYKHRLFPNTVCCIISNHVQQTQSCTWTVFPLKLTGKEGERAKLLARRVAQLLARRGGGAPCSTDIQAVSSRVGPNSI